eukprot:3999447-Alexandrium_andersonii.AAC.1
MENGAAARPRGGDVAMPPCGPAALARAPRVEVHREGWQSSLPPLPRCSRHGRAAAPSRAHRA